MPRFSIIVVYYQGVHPPEIFTRGIGSLLAQTFTDYELLVYHDGPLAEPVPRVDGQQIHVRATPIRHNDFGHSLRDLGIREARGDYILHFNADNILYRHCLAALEAESRRDARLVLNGKIVDTDSILIYPILYHDMQRFFHQWVRCRKGSGGDAIMTGNPPLFGQIDCMQLVMKRELWLREGGWANKAEASDGEMYPRFCAKYGYRGLSQVLGEHY